MFYTTFAYCVRHTVFQHLHVQVRHLFSKISGQTKDLPFKFEE